MSDARDMQGAIMLAEIAARPEPWLETARELLRAAALIRGEASKSERHDRDLAKPGGPDSDPPRDDVRGVYLLLVGFALENLFKYAIVRSDPKLVSHEIVSKRRLPDRLLGRHDLRVLANRAGLQVNERTELLLARLTRWTKWAGRYPAPPAGWPPADMAMMADGTAKLTAYLQADDTERTQKLVEFVCRELEIDLEQA